MNKVQIQITEIENGWLVSKPGEPIRTPQGMQMGPPEMTFCEDYEEVCQHLKSFWPRTIKV
jgi:hypothetical protein